MRGSVTNSALDVSQIKAGEGSFELPYDALVVAVGAVSNTFNTPGVVENANFLKSIEGAVNRYWCGWSNVSLDVQAIRTRVMDCFESANYPGLTDEVRELHWPIDVANDNPPSRTNVVCCPLSLLVVAQLALNLRPSCTVS